MEIIKSENIKILHSSAIVFAKNKAKSFAREIGFDTDETEKIAIVTNEIGSNLIKFASGGLIKISIIKKNKLHGIQIESVDNGPGIPDIDLAISDGFTTVGSLGYGLGTVNRMMDNLAIESKNGDTHLTCIKWLKPQTNLSFNNCLDIGAATRSHPKMLINGDAFVIKKWNGMYLAGVIDGLGHGQFAHKASQTAKKFIEEHYDQQLDYLFRGVGRICRATRGVVMALVKIDSTLKQCKHASIGDVEFRIKGKNELRNFIIRRGIIGINAPNPKINEFDINKGDIFFIFSDGILKHWQIEDFSKLFEESATKIAGYLLRKLAKDDDDATIIVIKVNKL